MPVEGEEFEELVRNVQSLPNQLFHVIKAFLPPLPPRPKPRDNGMKKQLEALKRYSKLTTMALYDLEDEHNEKSER
jgi:hypothetical protein